MPETLSGLLNNLVKLTRRVGERGALTTHQVWRENCEERVQQTAGHDCEAEKASVVRQLIGRQCPGEGRQ